MPDLGLTESEAETIAAFLLVKRAERGGVRGLVRRAYRRLFGEPTPWDGAFLGFAGGAVFMTAVFGLWLGVRRRRGRGGRAT